WREGSATTTSGGARPSPLGVSAATAARPAAAMSFASPDKGTQGTRATAAQLSAPSTTLGRQNTASPSPNSMTGRVRRRRIEPRIDAGVSAASSAVHQRQNRGRPARYTASRADLRNLLSRFATGSFIPFGRGRVRQNTPVALAPFEHNKQTPSFYAGPDHRFANEYRAIGHCDLRADSPDVERGHDTATERERRRRQFGRERVASLREVGIDDLRRSAGQR